jgi:hypothetical protein
VRSIAEREWKILRGIRERALGRFCARAVDQTQEIISAVDLEHEPHKSFLDVCRYVHGQNDELGRLFNDWRRSTALTTLALWAQAGILTEDELGAFSDETQDFVRASAKVRYYTDGEA